MSAGNGKVEASGPAQANNEALARLLAHWQHLDELQKGPRRLPLDPRAAVIERARLYLAKEPPAISGQHGHDRTFHVACILVQGFALSEEEALEAIQDWNRTCKPPWSEGELRHKLQDAGKAPLPPGKDRGYLLNAERNGHGEPDYGSHLDVQAEAEAGRRQLQGPAAQEEGQASDVQPNSRAAFTPPIPASLLRLQDLSRKWLWHGYLARGGITLLSALWKAGKSTLLAHLLKSLGTPGLFCDLRVSAGRVLYVTEESESRWAERRDAIGFGDWVEFQIRPFTRKKASWPEWRGLLAHIQALHAAKPYDLVVLDTLSNLWPLSDENEAPQVQAALQPLHSLGEDVAILAVHHLRKGDGQEATASRGSGALPAFVDTILELRRFNAGERNDCRRVLTAYGRDDDTHDEAVIELTPAGYIAHGNRSQVRQQGLTAILDGILPPVAPGLSYTQITEAWPGPTVPTKQAILDTLGEGIKAERWKREGSGRKGSPFTYWRPSQAALSDEVAIGDPFADS